MFAPGRGCAPRREEGACAGQRSRAVAMALHSDVAGPEGPAAAASASGNVCETSVRGVRLDEFGQERVCLESPRPPGRQASLSPPQIALYVLRTPPPRRPLASPVSAASARAPRVRPRSAWLWRVSRVVACVGSLFSREDWRGTCFRVCGVTVPCPCVGRRSPQRGLSAAAASQFLVLRQRKQTVRSRRPAQPPGRASPRALARLDVCALDPAARPPPPPPPPSFCSP